MNSTYSELKQKTVNETLNSVLIQYFPYPREICLNIKTIDSLLCKYSFEDKIDIVLLPEMALTGYIFDTQSDIEPYLEIYNNGETYNFCSAISQRLNCYVFCGYPEKTVDKSNDSVYYNSCMITDRQGKALPSYRKHFLYEMDKTWCIEGNEFGYLEIETRNGTEVKLGIGICMDLNPCEFKAPWEAMEFATFCLEKNVDVILFLNNWLDNEPEMKTKREVLHMINYWIMRLQPFLENELDKDVHFLAANRCGKERDTNFIGC